LPNLSDLLYRAVDGVFAVDTRQRIVLWNAACSQLLGISPKKALGRNCFEVLQGLSPMGRPFCQYRCNVAGLINGCRATRVFPIHIRSSDDQDLKLWVNIILVPSLGDDSWICMHLLRRNAPLNVLDALGGALPESRPDPEKRLRDIAASKSAAHADMYGFRDLRGVSSIVKFSPRSFEAPSKRRYAQDSRTLFS